MTQRIVQLGSWLRRFKTGRQGSITVEFVATLPIIIGALGLTYEFGRTLWAQQIATKDIREASRFLSRQALPLTSAAVTQAQNLAQTGQVAAGGSLHYPWTAASTFTVTNPLTTFSASAFRTAGNTIEVRGSIPFTISFLAFLGINTSVTLIAADQVRLIGN